MRFTAALGATLILLTALSGGAWWMLSEDVEPDFPPAMALPLPPFPPRIANDATYDACMALLPEDPAGALTLIAAWPTGGPAAGHCQALALIAQGHVEQAATILEILAATSSLPPHARSLLLEQAADAWLLMGAQEQAHRATTQAIKVMPDDPELLVRHARVASLIGRDAEAVSDLTRALQISPDRVDALLTRAAAWRRLDRPDQARGDIDRAAGIAPEDAEVLLERGIQRQQSGDLAGARQDWRQVVSLDPDSQAADLAEQNLALLDAGPVR